MMTADTMNDDIQLERLGHGRIDNDHLAELVARSLCVHGDVFLEQVRVTPVDYPTNTIATAALDRVSGIARVGDGSTHRFSIFVKQLRSARLWPLIHVIPEEHQHNWLTSFPWRIELDAFTSPLVDLMPAGLRMARLYEIVETAEDRATLWMEDVQFDPSRSWTSSDFVRAARLLGELAGRRPASIDTCLGELEMYRTPGLALRMYAIGRVATGAIPAVLAEQPWRTAGLDGAEYDDLRTGLRKATGAIDELLDRLDVLPQTYPHGDAGPQNLLIPVDEPDTFVVIDWGFNSPQAVGFDLGQLLIGLVNDDALSARDLPALEKQVVTAYTHGLHAVGFDASPTQVHEGFALAAVVRSMFTSLQLDEGGGAETSDHKANRVDLTRYLLNLYEEYMS